MTEHRTHRPRAAPRRRLTDRQQHLALARPDGRRTPLRRPALPARAVSIECEHRGPGARREEPAMSDHDDRRPSRELDPVEVEVELAGMRVGAELGGAATPPEAEDAARAILDGDDPATAIERAHREVLRRHGPDTTSTRERARRPRPVLSGHHRVPEQVRLPRPRRARRRRIHLRLRPQRRTRPPPGHRAVRHRAPATDPRRPLR